MKYEYGFVGSEYNCRLVHDTEFSQLEFDALVRTCIDPIIDELFTTYNAMYILEHGRKSFHVDESHMDDSYIDMEYINADMFVKNLVEYLIKHHGFQYNEYVKLSASFAYSQGAFSYAAHNARHADFANAMQSLNECAPTDTTDRTFFLAFMERMKKLPVVDLNKQ